MMPFDQQALTALVYYKSFSTFVCVWNRFRPTFFLGIQAWRIILFTFLYCNNLYVLVDCMGVLLICWIFICFSTVAAVHMLHTLMGVSYSRLLQIPPMLITCLTALRYRTRVLTLNMSPDGQQFDHRVLQVSASRLNVWRLIWQYICIHTELSSSGYRPIDALA